MVVVMDLGARREERAGVLLARSPKTPNYIPLEPKLV